MTEFTENDLREIERVRDLPPDEPPERVIWAPRFAEARNYILDAESYLTEAELDPEEALHCLRQAAVRIEALLGGD